MDNTATLGVLTGKPLRPSQVKAIDFISRSKRTYLAVRAPTGIGKTCLGFESMETPFYYICSSIPLQEQTKRDYSMETELLKGRNNYRCPNYETADLCVNDRPCDDCEYNLAKMAAMAKNRTILNFHYFMYASNFTKEFPLRNVIIDEADNLEKALVDFISFEFTESQLDWIGLRTQMPERKTKIYAIKEWLVGRKAEAKQLEETMRPYVQQIRAKAKNRKIQKSERVVLRKYKALSNILWKIDFLSRQDLAKNWIYRYEELRHKISLKPIWLKRELVDRFLLSHGGRFLFMSATLPAKEVFCGMYELKAEEVDYIDMPNVWDSDKRKIIYRPSYSLSYKNKNDKTYTQVKEAVQKIMAEQPGRGVIHTVSYQLAKLIESIGSDRIISHTSDNKRRMFERFKDTDGAIWISPSSTRGLDLPYDLCEWIVWLKAPFLHVRDPQVNARLYNSGKFGKLWYASDAVQTIIQGCGRGFRNEDDYCTVYMLDEQIGRLLRDQPKLWPMWFRDLVDYE